MAGSRFSPRRLEKQKEALEAKALSLAMSSGPNPHAVVQSLLNQSSDGVEESAIHDASMEGGDESASASQTTSLSSSRNLEERAEALSRYREVFFPFSSSRFVASPRPLVTCM